MAEGSEDEFQAELDTLDFDKCQCGLKAKLWTSANLGRRFFGCDLFDKEGGCQFFSYYEPPMCLRAKEVIPDFIHKIRHLEAAKVEVEGPTRKRERILWLLLFVTWVGIILVVLGTEYSMSGRDEL